jgi:hypothetical protein
MATSERVDLGDNLALVRNPYRWPESEKLWYLSRNGEIVRELDPHLETDLAVALSAAKKKFRQTEGLLRNACEALASQDLSKASAAVQDWHEREQRKAVRLSNKARRAVADSKSPPSLPLF